MIAMALIAKGIELAANAIDHYVNRAKYAAEAMEEAQQKIDDATTSLKQLSSTLEENKDRFLELSKGVNEFSNNVSLSEDDYKEYLSISQKFADLSPSLISGYDDQGNALLHIGKNAEETAAKLNEVLETQQNIAKQTLVDNLDDVAKGIYFEVDKSKGELTQLNQQLKDAQKEYAELQYDIADIAKNGNSIFTFNDVNDPLRTYRNNFIKALESAKITWEDVGNDQIRIAGYEHAVNNGGQNAYEIRDIALKEAQEYYDSLQMMDSNLHEANIAGLKKEISETEKEINNSYSKMTANLQAWVEQNYSYQYLADDTQKLVDAMIPKIDWNSLDIDLTQGSDYEDYITKNILNPLMSIPNEDKQRINDEIAKLLSFEDGDMNIVPFAQKLQAELKKLNIEIDLTPVIGDEEDAKRRLQNSIRTFTDDHGISNREDYSKLEEYTKDFNQAQIEAWLSATAGAKNADEAIKKYEESLKSINSLESDLSFTDVISQVQLLSDGLDQLDKIYADVLNKEDFDWSSILNNESFKNAFEECGNAYSDFIQTVSNSPDDIDACQEAFNNLASSYIENSGALNNLTEDTKQATITMLEQMGISNAEEVVTATLAHNKEELTLQNVLLANSTMDLSTVTAEEIQRLLDEGVVTEEVAKQLASYALEKQYTNDNVIKTEADCNNLITLMKTAEGTTDAVAKLEKLKARLYNEDGTFKVISNEERKNVENAINAIAAEFNAKVLETIKVPQMTYNGGSASQKARDEINKAADSAEKSADDLYNDLKEQIEAYLDFMEKSLDAGKIDYNGYCSSVKGYLDNLYNSGKLKAADYFNYIEQMLNKQKAVYDKVISAVVDRLDEEADKWQKKIDAIEEENDKLNEQKDTYDGILSAVEDVIDAETERYQNLIDNLEEANDKLEKIKDDKDGILSAIADVYDNQIDALNKQSDAIQDQIDALQDKTTEIDKQYNKEKALYELEKSQRLRNKKLYVEGKGYIYTQDTEAIRDAKKNLADIENEELIDNLKKEQDKISDAIENLQKYKEMWADVSSAYEKELNKQLAIAQFGYDFEKQILLNRESDIENFKNAYIAIQKEIDDNKEMIDSHNEKVDYYNKLKKQWSDISGAYDKETNKQAAIAKWGANYEQMILSGRISDINSFKNQYIAIQKQIDDNTALINSYNQKVDYYNKLKEQWQSLTDEYDKQRNAQYASQVLGANWEAQVLSGRLDKLNSFRSEYMSIQDAIAEAAVNSANAQMQALQDVADKAWQSANDQINAAKEAAKADSGSTGSSTTTSTTTSASNEVKFAVIDEAGKVLIVYRGKDSYTKARAYLNNLDDAVHDKSRCKVVQQFAKGGVVHVDPSNVLFSNIANQAGEDTLVGVRDGERILTPVQNKWWEEWTDNIPQMFSLLENIPHDAFTGMNDLVRNLSENNVTKTVSNNQPVTISIGDIVLQGVQNPDQLADAIIKYMPGTMKQKLSKSGR